MKLATFHIDGRDRFGVLVNGRLVDLGAALVEAGADPAEAPRTMLELVQNADVYLPKAASVAEEAARSPDRFKSYDPAAVVWRAPLPNPSKIVCIALNNSANSDRILEGPKHPASFIKPASSLTGHLEPIECRDYYGRVHPEPEMAVILSKTGKDVSVANAMDHVFGYTVHNDITSPTMRREDTFHYRAIHPKGGDHTTIEYVDTWVSYPGRYKCSDTFSPMGPYLVTKDEIPDPHALRVRCLHKGQVVTDDNTLNLSYKVAETIAFLSGYMTLLSGDIISMGTALARTGTGQAVQNIDLGQLGGPISVEIEGLGLLENPVVQTAAAARSVA